MTKKIKGKYSRRKAMLSPKDTTIFRKKSGSRFGRIGLYFCPHQSCTSVNGKYSESTFDRKINDYIPTDQRDFNQRGHTFKKPRSNISRGKFPDDSISLLVRNPVKVSAERDVYMWETRPLQSNGMFAFHNGRFLLRITRSRKMFR